MRKDVKTGMMIGTGLSLLAVVWFSVTQMASSPPNSLHSQFVSEDVVTAQAKPDIVYQPPKQRPIATTVAQPKPQTIPTTITTKKTITHKVVSGQTLSDISKRYYNTTTGWRKIYEANKAKFPKGPDAIKVGVELIIPE